MTIPDQYQIWFPDRVREMLGLNDIGMFPLNITGWLVAGEYIR